MMTQNNVISVALEISNFGTISFYSATVSSSPALVHTNVQQASRHGSQQKGRLEALKAFPTADLHCISYHSLSAVEKWQYTGRDNLRQTPTIVSCINETIFKNEKMLSV